MSTVTLRQDELDQPVVEHVRRDYTPLLADQTVAEALVHLRSVQLAEKIIYFYVVDGANRLVGVVPTRRLLMSPIEARIADIMVTRVISIPHTMSVLEACEFFVMHRLLAFPVVDEENHLIGIIDVSLFTEEMFDVTEKQAAKDVFQLIGVRLEMGRRRESPLVGFRNRFPWLLCNIGGGIICAFLAGLYESFLDSVIVLALFIPVVLALAESVSVQSMTITLQSLHGRRVGWRNTLRAVTAEFLTAVLLGSASGLLVGLVALVWKRQPAVAAAIGASICLAIITACLLGILLPTALRAFRDPKIASGPIVLATADVATLLFYFNLAGLMLG